VINRTDREGGLDSRGRHGDRLCVESHCQYAGRGVSRRVIAACGWPTGSSRSLRGGISRAETKRRGAWVVRTRLRHRPTRGGHPIPERLRAAMERLRISWSRVAARWRGQWRGTGATNGRKNVRGARFGAGTTGFGDHVANREGASGKTGRLRTERCQTWLLEEEHFTGQAGSARARRSASAGGTAVSASGTFLGPRRARPSPCRWFSAALDTADSTGTSSSAVQICKVGGRSTPPRIDRHLMPAELGAARLRFGHRQAR